MKRRLITCSDGTWNRPGITDRGQPVKSNVELIYNCISEGSSADNVEQVKMYDCGVGSSSFNFKDQILGGTSGDGIDKNITDAYKFLVYNYRSGDDIYIFGFSRGAYTARSLAGFINNCGILKPEFVHLTDEAYSMYRDRNTYTHPNSDLMKGFRASYCRDAITPIKYLGVWDTVGSLGIPLPWYKMYNKNRYHFHDVTLSSIIENAYHALAIDEKRKLFEPTLWRKSMAVKNDPNHPQKLEQRWFAGVHCNIGGGYVDHGLSDLALNWLMEKASSAGLHFNTEKLLALNPKHELTFNPKGELRNSRSAMYWFWRPTWRTLSLNKDSNETLDESVIKRMELDSNYRPRNLKEFWPK